MKKLKERLHKIKTQKYLKNLTATEKNMSNWELSKEDHQKSKNVQQHAPPINIENVLVRNGQRKSSAFVNYLFHQLQHRKSKPKSDLPLKKIEQENWKSNPPWNQNVIEMHILNNISVSHEGMFYKINMFTLSVLPNLEIIHV